MDVFSIIYSNADYLLIGRFMGSVALGVYTVAFRIHDLVINQMCNVISQVVFPVFVTMQEKTEKLQDDS